MMPVDSNKMVTPYNGPAAKLLTPPTLTPMTITRHADTNLQSASPKIAQALISTLAQVSKVT